MAVSSETQGVLPCASDAEIKPAVVVAVSAEWEGRARHLAAGLHCGTASREEALADGSLMVLVGDDGLSLSDGTMVVRGDFARMLLRLKPANLKRELLVKAAKVKNAQEGLHAVDATAGLGEDSLLLAAAGFSVTMYERNPVIAALLQDALDRALLDVQLAPVVQRMRLACADSVAALAGERGPDVVLLDPMFPSKTKSSSAKKKLQLLQRLEAPCEDERALLDAGLAANPRKVVVKRPAKGPWLAGEKPSYSLAGKAVRFDCYVR